MSNEDAFVLMKRGVFWRPHSCGYTSNILYAGIYYRPEIEEAWWTGDGNENTKAIPLLLAIDHYADGATPEIVALIAERARPAPKEEES